MGELAKLIESHLASHSTNGASVDAERCLDKLRSAATDLARIGRSHLGLERLPDNLIDPRQRFLGSFRGRELDQHEAAFS
jgi:hypothetical protein